MFSVCVRLFCSLVSSYLWDFNSRPVCLLYTKQKRGVLLLFNKREEYRMTTFFMQTLGEADVSLPMCCWAPGLEALWLCRDACIGFNDGRPSIRGSPADSIVSVPCCHQGSSMVCRGHPLQYKWHVTATARHRIGCACLVVKTYWVPLNEAFKPVAPRL